MKILILFMVLILMTSCGADIAETASVTSSVAETTVVSSESLTETMTATTTAKTTTTAPIISTYETTTTVYNQLKNAVELNDVFYIDIDKSILYLFIDGEITDKMEVADEFVFDFSLRSAESVYENGSIQNPRTPVTFNIPPAIIVGERYYIALDRKITELKFLIEGKELDLEGGVGPVPAGILPISDISFAEYINPEYVLNAEELGFEGKAIFTYNADNHTFEGEVWHNDKSAEAIATGLFNNLDKFAFLTIPSEYYLTITPENRLGDKSKLVEFDNYSHKYSKGAIEGYRTSDEFMNLIKSIYTDEIAETIFNELLNDSDSDPKILEKDGVLYFLSYEEESFYYYENIYHYLDIVSVSENRIEARIVSSIPVNDKYDYKIEYSNMVFGKTENGWRISYTPFEWWLNL
jgi:hypothetical protein